VPYNAAGDASGSPSVDLFEPEIWRYRKFYDIDPTLANPVSDWESDPDADGLSTLLEYAYSRNPLAADPVETSGPQLESDQGDTFLRIQIPWDGRRKVTFEGMFSTDLEFWDVGEPFTSLFVNELGEYYMRSNVPLQSESKQFIMYRVSLD
jgi:hypothetical protein